MPVDFGTGGAASVDLGSGAHSPQIRFTADDESCMWNDCGVVLFATMFDPITPTDPTDTYQLNSIVTTGGGGATEASDTDWPYMRVYEMLRSYLSGWDLEMRISFFATTLGTSVGSWGVERPGSTPCFSGTGPILGAFDSGWGSTLCANCIPPDAAEFTERWTNFSPLGGTVQIDDGHLQARWVQTSTTPLADWEPAYPYRTWFTPPCGGDPGVIPLSMFDLGGPCGLYIQLPTSDCGVLTKTYTNIANDVNALALGITATVLGGHGADIVTPVTEVVTGIKAISGSFSGADCTGAADN